MKTEHRLRRAQPGFRQESVSPGRSCRPLPPTRPAHFRLRSTCRPRIFHSRLANSNCREYCRWMRVVRPIRFRNCASALRRRAIDLMKSELFAVPLRQTNSGRLEDSNRFQKRSGPWQSTLSPVFADLPVGYQTCRDRPASRLRPWSEFCLHWPRQFPQSIEL